MWRLPVGLWAWVAAPLSHVAQGRELAHIRHAAALALERGVLLAIKHDTTGGLRT